MDEIGTEEAAQILQVHRNTVRSWADKALAGEKSFFAADDVRMNPLTGRVYIRQARVLELAEAARSAEDPAALRAQWIEGMK